MSLRPDMIIPRGAMLAILALLFALQLYAFHWGVTTPDTIFQWKQALTGQYDDWHPPATTWLWRQLMVLGPGAAPILIFQCLLYWSGIGLIADRLRRDGAGWRMALLILCAALPIPFGQMGAILKDPLLGACCLFAAGLLVAFRQTRWRPAAFTLAAIILIFASATRFNAVFATAPLFAAWLPDRWLASLWRAALCWVGCGLLLAGAGWLINNPLLRPHASQPIYSQVNFDLAGILAQGGGNFYPNLDAGPARRITATCYDPSMYNPTYRTDCDQVEIDLSTYVAHHHGMTPARLWVRAIATAPTAYIRHRIAHLNRNWRFLVRADQVPDDAVYVMTIANPFGIAFHENALTQSIAHAARIMALSPFGRPVTWLAVALGLLVMGVSSPRRLILIPVTFSTLSYGFGYAIFSVAPDMRYHFWTMIGTMAAVLIAAPELKPGRRLLFAAMPLIFVLIGEATCLL